MLYIHFYNILYTLYIKNIFFFFALYTHFSFFYFLFNTYIFFYKSSKKKVIFASEHTHKRPTSARLKSLTDAHPSGKVF